MKGRQSLTTLGLSLMLHALLVLAIGFFLNQPTRIIQHIEIDLGTTAAPQSTGEAPMPAPAPKPEQETPKPKPDLKPAPKPVAKPLKLQMKPRPAASRPIVAPAELTKPLATSTAPDTPPVKPTTDTGVTNVPESSTANSKAKSSSATGGSGGTTRRIDPSALQAYLAAIRARIEAAKRYPFAAEQRRIQGMVTVSFSLNFEGRLMDEPSVVTSSGFSILDRAALRAIKQAKPFPRFPGSTSDMPVEPLSVELKFMMR